MVLLSCALTTQVVVLERTREAGKKVLMSGGTRCNVLPLEVDLAVREGLCVEGGGRGKRERVRWREEGE